MKKLLILLLLCFPLAMMGQTFDIKVINISGVGNVNIVRWTPPAVASSRLITVVQFPGNGESGSDPSKAFVFGPLWSVKNHSFQPSDMQFIFVQTPYSGGTFNNPIAGAFLRGAMQYVKSLPTTDTNKIILTGLSSGADHVMFYMQKEDASHYIPIAGIIPMSMNMFGSVGNSPNDQLGGNDSRFNKTPIYAICGDADPFFSQMYKFYTYRNDPTRQANPANPVKLSEQFSTIKGAHNGEWNLAYDESGVTLATGAKISSIYDWIRTQVSTVIPAPPVIIPKKAILTTTFTVLYADSTKETITRP